MIPGFTGLWLAGNEGMEMNMENIIMGYRDYYYNGRYRDYYNGLYRDCHTDTTMMCLGFGVCGFGFKLWMAVSLLRGLCRELCRV